MKKRAAEILLAIIIMARATGYLFSTICLQEVGVFTLLAERFLLAGCLLMLLLRKKLQWNRCTIGRGCLLGLAYFLCMACELTSLKTTPTSTVSLLENNAMILVPLLEWIIYKKKPNKHTILCALVALAGVYFLTAIGVKFQPTVGELLSIGAALFSATAILLTAHFAVDSDGLSLGVFEVTSLGFYALLICMLFESPCLPQSPASFGSLLYLSVICTGFAYTLQPVVQRKLDADSASIFFAINPVFAFLIGVLILHEPITWQRITGSLLILTALFISRGNDSKQF